LLHEIAQRSPRRPVSIPPTVTADDNEDAPVRFTAYDKADGIGDRIIKALKGKHDRKLGDVAARVFAKSGNTEYLDVHRTMGAILDGLDDKNRTRRGFGLLTSDEGSALVKDKDSPVARRLGQVVAHDHARHHDARLEARGHERDRRPPAHPRLAGARAIAATKPAAGSSGP
jgi:hypothetical protein